METTSRKNRRGPNRSGTSACDGTGERLIIFTRYPRPGTTKTRLIPALGKHGAADLQRCMTEHMLARARELARSRPVSIEVAFEGGSEKLMRGWLGAGVAYRPQYGADLGERMLDSFRYAVQGGARRVVIVGTDCPEITPGLLDRAFEALGSCDLILGPAEDGGYYLIGTRRVVPELFRDMPWGTAAVLERTIDRARQLAVGVSLLEPLRDVDRPEDLRVWKQARAAATERISVIIPTINESELVGAAIQSARRCGTSEIIVVDGGSRDETRHVAREHGAKVLVSDPGRAVQQNAGAAAASGEVFLFLHGDTQLPAQYDRHVRSVLAKPRTVAGAFELGLDASGPLYRRIERRTNFRSRVFQVPYGDQALFLRADRFRRLGGFPRLPFMEDYAFVLQLRRCGVVRIARVPVTSSARRWTTVGPFRATVINQIVVMAYHAGVRPARLAQWYQARNRQR